MQNTNVRELLRDFWLIAFTDMVYTLIAKSKQRLVPRVRRSLYPPLHMHRHFHFIITHAKQTNKGNLGNP